MLSASDLNPEVSVIIPAYIVTQYFLQQEVISENPKLMRALSKRLVLLEATKPYFLF
jgi:hypothetical protein